MLTQMPVYFSENVQEEQCTVLHIWQKITIHYHEWDRDSNSTTYYNMSQENDTDIPDPWLCSQQWYSKK